MGGGGSKQEGESVSPESMDRVFKWLDTDHSGFIEMEELLHWVNKEPKFEQKDKEVEAKNLMEQVDKDQDGKISPAEFKEHFGEFTQTDFDDAFQSVKAVETSKIQTLFRVLDVNQDGYVDRQEFKAWVADEAKLEQADEEKLFKSIDVSGNDRISPEELVKYYSNFTQEQLHRITESLYSRHAARLANIRAEESKELNDFQFLDEEQAAADEKWEAERLTRQPDEPVKPGYQRETIKHLLTEAEEKLGSAWYAISFSWWRCWKEYVGYDEEENNPTGDEPPNLRRSLSFTYGQMPGAIDNTDIAGERAGELKLGIREGYDFVLVPETAWNQVREWYGGGPTFRRVVVTSGNTTRVDLWPHILICVWADSVTGKPNPATVSRQFVSRSANLKGLVERLTKEKSEEEKRPIDSRLWVKPHEGDGEGEDAGGERKNERWVQVPDEQLEEPLEQFGSVVSGDTVLLEAKNEVKEWPRDQYSASGSSKKNWRDFEIGDQIDACDPQKSWYQSVVRDVKPEKIFVHYEGWSAQYDEWFPRDSDRLAPVGTNTSGKYQSKRQAYQWSRGSNTEGTPDVPGVVGLRNLGNTCFMNSTLQCMSNTKVLTDFFVSDEYKNDLNRDNPLGHMGRVADEYAGFLKDVWSNNYSVVAPAKFKTQIGEFAPQFSGYQQQDSSELLSFLLDGLHEDLNRIQQKPYTQDVESNGRPDEKVAQEAFETYRKRNDSFIVDQCSGQLKSTIVCPLETCGRVNVKFDPYFFLSVPLPIPTTRSLVVTLVPSDGGAPTVYGITVPKVGTVADVISEVRTLAEMKESREITLADVTNHRVSRVLKPKNQVSGIRERDVLYAFEYEKLEPVKVPGLEGDEWRAEMKIGSICDAKDSEGNWYESDVVACDDEKVTVHFCDWPHKWNEEFPRNDPRIQSQHTHSEPTMYTVNCFHLKEVPNSHWTQASPRPQTTPKPFGVPFIVSFQSYSITNNEFYAKIASKVQHIVKEDAKGDDLFDIVVYNSSGTRCNISVCDKKSQRSCRGCVLPRNDMKIELMQQISLGILWKGDEPAFDEEATKQVVRHESAPTQEDDDAAPVGGKNLYDCLRKFTEQETLGKDDMWYCRDCKEHKQAKKKFDIWSTPEVLIIHLKRFSFTRVWREKLDMYVDFPLDGLDLSEFCLGPPPEGVDAPIYDCYGISNHMGGLGGGHYTAYTRNPTNGKWYNCDDSHTNEVSPAQVKTKAAYLLFYRLRRN